MRFTQSITNRLNKDMQMMITCLCLGALGTAAFAQAPEDTAPEPTPPPNPMRLLLPPAIYAVPGVEINIYFDNVALTIDPTRYAFDVACARGRQQSERWTYTPTAADVGTFSLSLAVYDEQNTLLAQAATRIVVSPADAGAGRDLSMLIIGDSLTNASVYSGHILDLCAAAENPAVRLIGSHGPGAADGSKQGGNRHEGYGGWTAQRFATHYTETARTGNGKLRGSPFLYKDGDAEPKLDFRRYCAEFNEGNPPDVVTILLGCNDTFSATDETIEERIDVMFSHYETLLAMVREVAPDAEIGALLLVPPAASQDAFGANYACGQTRWQYRRNQHRVVERMLEQFGNRETEGLFLVPAVCNLDCARNYPQRTEPANSRSETPLTRLANGVHPGPDGYRQIGDSIYCWLKARLAEQPR